jgi:hypothetical protein
MIGESGLSISTDLVRRTILGLMPRARDERIARATFKEARLTAGVGGGQVHRAPLTSGKRRAASSLRQ